VGTTEHAPSPSGAAGTVEPRPGGLSRPARILVAEDDLSLRALIRLTVEPGRTEVDEAEDGRSAIARARERPPDLVLLDWAMPGCSGLDVCRALRADPLTAATRIVMITARAGADDRRAALAAGVDRYLTKPFSPLELLDTVRDVLGSDVLA
jgi:CheY-like chemotaxis protein